MERTPIDKELESTLSGNLKKHENDIIASFSNILGKEFKDILTSRIKRFVPVFMVREDDINQFLEAEVNPGDKQLLEYFQKKFSDSKIYKYGDNEDEIYIGYHEPVPTPLDFVKHTGIDYLNVEGFLMLSNNAYSSIEFINSKLTFFYKHYLFYPIFDNNGNVFDESYDGRYIFELLDFVGAGISDGKIKRTYELFKLSSDIPNIEHEITRFITSDITTLICNDLHQKGIFLIDTESKILNHPKYQPFIPNKFYEYFLDILALFVYSPNRFIDIVGIDNFTEFAELVVSHAEENNISEAIDKMIQEREQKVKYEIVGVNISLIDEALKKKEQQEKEKIQESELLYQRPISVMRSVREQDPLSEFINNDIEIIENKYKNIKLKKNFLYPNDEYNENNFRKR